MARNEQDCVHQKSHRKYIF